MKNQNWLKDRSLKEVIVEISAKRLGVTAVVDDEDNLLGIITDGDLRRMLEKNISLDGCDSAADIMTANTQNHRRQKNWQLMHWT